MAEDIPSTVENFRPFRVSIEGNIGAGKSTVINYFTNIPEVEIYTEPINWWRNVNGYNLLNLFYSDINKYYCTFQKYVQLTRVQIQTSPPKFPNTTTQIFERSLQNNRHCFMKVAKQADFIQLPDFHVLENWFQWIEKNIDIDLDLIVYLKTSPEVVYERLKKRNRQEESSISFEYIQDLHFSHEKWLLDINSCIKREKLLIIDADKSLDEVLEQCRINREKIISPNLVPNKNKSKFLMK